MNLQMNMHMFWLAGNSRNPEVFNSKLIQEIENIKKNGLNQDDFERTKKMIYGEYIKEYNDISNIARMFLSDFMKGINSFDYLEEITSLDQEYLIQILNNNFKQEKMVFSVIKND